MEIRTLVFNCAECGTSASDHIATEFEHKGFCSKSCKSSFWKTRFPTAPKLVVAPVQKLKPKIIPLLVPKPVVLSKRQRNKAKRERKLARKLEKRRHLAKLRESRFDYRAKSEVFLSSREWKKLRFKAFVKFGRRCMCCGSKPPDVILHVDHIKPRYNYPELALELGNLQVLCADCNQGKGAKYETDFREKV